MKEDLSLQCHLCNHYLKRINSKDEINDFGRMTNLKGFTLCYSLFTLYRCHMSKVFASLEFKSY